VQSELLNLHVARRSGTHTRNIMMGMHCLNRTLWFIVPYYKLTVACVSSGAAVRLAAAGSLLDASRATLHSAVRAAAAVTLTHALPTSTWAAVGGGAAGVRMQIARHSSAGGGMVFIAG
jgi:hypothetical protein